MHHKWSALSNCYNCNHLRLQLIQRLFAICSIAKLAIPSYTWVCQWSNCNHLRLQLIQRLFAICSIAKLAIPSYTWVCQWSRKSSCNPISQVSPTGQASCSSWTVKPVFELNCTHKARDSTVEHIPSLHHLLFKWTLPYHNYSGHTFKYHQLLIQLRVQISLRTVVR